MKTVEQKRSMTTGSADMIYCVEDDSGVRDLMLYTLNSSGFEAKGFMDGNSLFDALKTETPQLIMLDIMLPGEDGISILKKLRRKPDTADIPVIMATAKGTEYDKVIGLDMGADDYLAKPFGMMEMISRIRAVLRRIRPKAAERLLHIGSLELNPETYAVLADGIPISLTRKEYQLLRILMENPGRVFTRDQLLEIVWGVDYIGETRTIDVHIGTLRMKLGACGDYIETIRGVGYRMVKGVGEQL